MFKTDNSDKYSKLLTQIKVCYRPVTVQFGLQFFILAVHLNSFRVEVNSIAEISFFCILHCLRSRKPLLLLNKAE